MNSHQPGWAETVEARTLVGLFERHSAEVMLSGEGQQLIANAFHFPNTEYRERTQKPVFSDPFHILVGIRARVDLIRTQFPDDECGQLRMAGALLKKYRRQNASFELGLARRFIEASLAPAWKPRQIAKFADMADFFSRYRDYFLSYSNRSADRVNTSFAYVCYDETKSYFREHRMKVNLLARQIVCHLSGLWGFYDVNQIVLGVKIRDEILDGAASAHVFLQIVTRSMLEAGYDETENWCYREYIAYNRGVEMGSAFDRGRDRLFIFLIGERLERHLARPPEAVQPPAAQAVHPPTELRDAYKPWYNHMLEVKAAAIERRTKEDLERQILDVRSQINRFRNAALDRVVPDEFGAWLLGSAAYG